MFFDDIAERAQEKRELVAAIKELLKATTEVEIALAKERARVLLKNLGEG